jgi:hypothetical protein
VTSVPGRALDGSRKLLKSSARLLANGRISWFADKGRCRLLQRLARSTRPDEVLAAYAEFWRRAGEDYDKEVTTMTTPMTEITSKMAVAAQPATEETNSRLLQREAA